MKKILVAVDGSESSKKAAQKGALIAESLGAEVTLINVISEAVTTPLSGVSSSMPIETLQDLMEQKEQELKYNAEKILREDAQYFKERGVDVEKLIRYGNPADVICNYAEEKDFDMIVMADKGHGGVKRFLLGSISDKVVRHAQISVLVVK
ncbi:MULTISPECIES: universal stress protein [unclassified Halanaerobium]|uniref:universal stress protein n=1 Tax=unclassified Halanaerobium TaxID=2641197 RepID=UPI000DF3F82F|nr:MULTISPECIES: universal stress protein [unclassified Halanaerobium]RCW48811.1 nucleotide-binding universal stress UspA family protein [Halanaerobium sp. MA284_MarDTE_T2]RCW89153.1 nucleotide-binding universal stress UspA family protein [Halanaerobium sp. DL-01]